MNIGIIGLGSIGRKHAKLLLSQEGVNVIALRTKKGALNEVDAEMSQIKEVYDFSTFKKQNLNAVVISTPTRLHVQNILEVQELNIPLLVEKPISSDLDELKAIQENTEHIRVAFCLRLHPGVIKIKQIIESGIYGKLLKAQMEVGQYLPSWHPYTDYRKEYFSRAELGGGALRTLSHEIDLAHYWLGAFTHTQAVVHKISELEIDVDDNCISINQHKNEAYSQITIDFLARNVKRKGSLIFEDAELVYDLIKGSISVYKYNEDEVKIPLESNHMYENQTVDFLNFVKGEPSRTATFEESKHVMHVIEAMEKASKHKKQTVI